MRKKKDHKEIIGDTRRYTDVNFDDLVNSALGLVTTKDQEEMEDEKKHMKAIEIDLIKMMHEGQWAKISEFKYRYPHLKIWVGELEYSYWSQKDAMHSYRQ